jgi:hypothetical protein
LGEDGSIVDIAHSVVVVGDDAQEVWTKVEGEQEEEDLDRKGDLACRHSCLPAEGPVKAVGVGEGPDSS